jgi:5-methylcytosine-specific restriction endonuclease McrA
VAVRHLGDAPTRKEVGHAARRVAFTRFNVFLCARSTCQYGGKASAKQVIPRSRRSRTTWSNIVTVCAPCNTRKGNVLRMKPQRPPQEPTPRSCSLPSVAYPPRYLHESWMDYPYWDA